MAVFLTVTLIDMLASGETSLHWSLLLNLLREFGIGCTIGLAGGWMMLQLVNRINLANGLYPILVVAGGLVVFALTNALHGNGFLAVYLCGLVIGNSPIRNRHGILHMLDGMALAGTDRHVPGAGFAGHASRLAAHRGPGTGLGVVDDPVRPPVVRARACCPSKPSTPVKSLISWVGLRGAVPIILAVFPLMAGLSNAQLYFNLAFFIVLVSLLVQGTSLPWVAKLLKVTVPPGPWPPSPAQPLRFT